MSVPVHFENDGLSPGLKRGGVLNVIRHTVEVYTEPEHIPEQFTADLADLDFNDAVRWEDLKGTENTRPVIDRNFVVATVAPPTKQAEVAAEPTAAAAAAPAAAAPARGGTGARRCAGDAAAARRGADRGVSCCSGSASAIRSRGWPGTGTTSASWRSTRSPSATASAPWRQRFKGLMSEGSVAGEKILALKPQTYMNESGASVQQAAAFYKLPTEAITAFHDELDLVPGKVRVKRGGGAAGHNGLRSMDRILGTQDYWRVRLGIGHPGQKERVLGHVLGDFVKEDREWLLPVLDAVADAAPLLVQGKPEDFMTKVALLAREPK